MMCDACAFIILRCHVPQSFHHFDWDLMDDIRPSHPKGASGNRIPNPWLAAMQTGGIDFNWDLGLDFEIEID